ncbi:retrovirus-related Pol polyprotein from transposon 412 [Trichonephila clavipes]|nr:retrovirus-related Pol polyprotein from transposon 412 [Trichonephila clavipes]
MIIDTGSQCVYHSERSGSKIKRETYLDPTPRGATDRDGEKIDIHGKLKSQDPVWRHYLPTCCVCHRYCRPFHSSTGLSKGAWFHSRLQQERITFHTRKVTIFKIKHRTESIRQVAANENITIPPRTEIIVAGYIGNDSSNVCLQKFELALSNSPQQLTPDLLENAELSPEQKISAERLFQEFEDVFSRNSSDIGHTTVTQHRIDTADHPPIKQHPRRLPFAKQEEVGHYYERCRENDIIEPSSSPWASQSSWFVRKMAPQDFAWTIENLTTSPRRTATLFQG